MKLTYKICDFFSSVQLPSSHLILTSTQTLYDSYLISCTAAIPEERVTQVHWKERLTDGKYNMIAVLNTVWGNATQLSYQLIVKLSKMDETTYTLEIAEASKVVCCEVITYPSGVVQENCLMVEGDSGKMMRTFKGSDGKEFLLPMTKTSKPDGVLWGKHATSFL